MSNDNSEVKQKYKDTAMETASRFVGGVLQTTGTSLKGGIGLGVVSCVLAAFLKAADAVFLNHTIPPALFPALIKAVGDGVEIGVVLGGALAPILTAYGLKTKGIGRLIQVGAKQHTRRTVNQEFSKRLVGDMSVDRVNEFLLGFKECSTGDNTYLTKQFPQILADLIKKDLEIKDGKENIKLMGRALQLAQDGRANLLEAITPEMVASWIQREVEKEKSSSLEFYRVEPVCKAGQYYRPDNEYSCDLLEMIDFFAARENGLQRLLGGLDHKMLETCVEKMEERFVFMIDKNFSHDKGRATLYQIKFLDRLEDVVRAQISNSSGQENKNSSMLWTVKNMVSLKKKTLEEGFEEDLTQRTGIVKKGANALGIF